MGESQGWEKPHRGEKDEGQCKKMDWKARVRSNKSFTLKDNKQQTKRANKKRFPGGRSRKHERISGRKDSPGEPRKSRLHSKSGQT